MKRTPTILTACMAWAVSWNLLAQPTQKTPPYVVAVNDQRAVVDRIDSKPNGDLVIYVQGVPREIKRDQWKYAVGVRPDALDEAAQLSEDGKADEAIELLQTVMRAKESRFLAWDVVAGLSLIDLYLEKKDANAALAVHKSLTERYGELVDEMFPKLEMADWKIQVGLGNTEGLEEKLTEAIRGKDRERGARAQLIRGDIKAKAGFLKKAQLDYLRTAYFFKNEDSIQPEALFKIAVTFKALGETADANLYFQKLKETYPDSEFAAKADK